MRFVVQRVQYADVKVDEKTVGAIGKGFLVLIGISKTDNQEIADRMVKKLCLLRIFEDGNGKTNLSLSDVEGAMLMISQFTLYADCKKGYRPGFSYAGEPQMASDLYDYVVEASKQYVPEVQKGIFGADMKVSLLNDGPFTVILDSDELF